MQGIELLRQSMTLFTLTPILNFLTLKKMQITYSGNFIFVRVFVARYIDRWIDIFSNILIMFIFFLKLRYYIIDITYLLLAPSVAKKIALNLSF